MAFCSKCGAQLADGVKFCGNCGAKVEQTSQNSSQRKTTFDGEIHKCPNCGEVLKAFETVCPSCGYEIRGTGASKVVTDFNEKLEQAENESQKITAILTYPIPTTKEDIYELFLLAYSNFDINLYVKKLDSEDITDAWYSLIKRCYEKAKISFGNHTEFAYIEKQYSQLDTKLKKLHKRIKLNKNKGLIIATSILVLILLVVAIILLVTEPKIIIGKSAAEFKGTNYEEVITYLENKGFTNIQTEERRGTIAEDIFYDNNDVYSISINASTKFKQDSSFHADVLIIITIYIT